MSRWKWNRGTGGLKCFVFLFFYCSVCSHQSTLNEVGHSGLYLSKSHCKLPGILFLYISPPPSPPPPLDALSNRFQFPEIPFLVKLFIIFLQRVLLHASKVCNFSTLVPLCFTILRMFLSSSPFTRKSEKNKMPCFFLFFN